MDINSIFPMASLTFEQLSNLMPLFILSFGALFSLLLGTHKTKGYVFASATAFVFVAWAIIHSLVTLYSNEMLLFGGVLNFTPFTKTVSLMILFFALIGIVVTFGQDRKEGLLPEIYSLILFSAAGMSMMVSTTHLLFMFIALEIMSLAIYVMVAMRRSSRFSAEAGLKYFILGGLASAIFLYGSSLIFGSLGSFELSALHTSLSSLQVASPIFYIGLSLLVAAMLFKIGAFPFHGWVADVYQGAATNVTGYMGAAVKFTAFIALTKIAQSLMFVETIAGLKYFQCVIWLAAGASMIFGNFVAISQTELKRMLSFSTIAHSGYLLLGLYALQKGLTSSESMITYLFFYAVANLGAFAVISSFETKNQKDLSLDQISGLGMKHPVLGMCLTIFLLSMAGIPLTSGFIGKYGLFSSAVNAGEIPLVIIAVLTSVVSVYYYLRVIVYMFMKDSSVSSASFQNLKGAGFAALITAAATVQFGIFPKAILQFIKMIAK
jgi:NADH-quinone oxidoreductase subunit N